MHDSSLLYFQFQQHRKSLGGSVNNSPLQLKKRNALLSNSAGKYSLK